MEERSVPWWRKALHFALDGIRSGFGLFSRTPIKNESPEPARPAAQQENPKEESELINHPPTLIPEIAPEVETRAAVEEVTSAPLAAPSVQALSQVDPEPEPVAETLPEPSAPVPPEALPVTEPAPEFHALQTETEAEVEAPEEAPAGTNAAALEPEPIKPPEQIRTVEEPHVTATHFPEEPVNVVQAAPEPTPEPIAEIAADLPVESAAPPAAETEDDTPESPLPLTALPTTVLESEPEPIQPADEPAEIELTQETQNLTQTDPTAPLALAENVDPVPVHNPVSVPAASPVESNESVAIEAPTEPVEQPALAEVDAEADVEENVEVESLVEAVLPAEPVQPSEAEPPAKEQDPEQEPPQIMEMNEPIPEQNSDQPTESASGQAADEREELVPPSSEPPVEAAPNPPVDSEPEAAPALANPPAHKPLIKLQSRDNQADLSPFSVIVDQVYDGPLDLLLDLIRKQDIDIYDIPISRITAQFLAYVNQLKATDVDVAGEFIYTASLLIHIKSKMLLPRTPSGPDDAAEDPRRELVERLLEHERFKNAAQMLQQKQMLEAASWSNPGIHEFRDDVSAEPEIAADTVDLVRIFRDILERARNRPVINVEEDSVTVGQMIQFLARRLTMEDKPVALRRLLSHTRSERALIAMFLALLELVRMQAILLRQDRAFSEIFIKKQSGFENLMNEGLANARDDWQ